MKKAQVKHLDYWRGRIAEQHAQSQKLAQQARSDLARIVALLVHEFGAKRIILYGSLVSGRFAMGSDIDLAVEGISPDDYFAALAAANHLTRIWVDLKPLEDLEPHFRRRALTTGEALYEKNIC